MLQVFVKDPVDKCDIFVRNLKPGQFFGETALITKMPRSASIRPKNYAVVGKVKSEKFDEMLFMFPELKERFKKHQFTYHDKYKQWLYA